MYSAYSLAYESRTDGARDWDDFIVYQGTDESGRRRTAKLDGDGHEIWTLAATAEAVQFSCPWLSQEPTCPGHCICHDRAGSVAAHGSSRCPSCGSQRSEEHTSELQSRQYLVCRLLLEKT